MYQQTEATEFPFDAVVITLAIGKTLGQAITGDLIPLDLARHQVQGQRYVAGKGLLGYDPCRFLVQPFLGRAAISNAAGGAHVVVGAGEQIRLFLDKVVAPMLRRG
ncbi:hypothetical protein D3C78_1193710 [compost metagenome]